MRHVLYGESTLRYERETKKISSDSDVQILKCKALHCKVTNTSLREAF